ncbi:hypothetical protein Btru_041822 [Bulinus truncatus]|nr:hypothetical protein Btru_041822 [Bulinus truncatus]
MQLTRLSGVGAIIGIVVPAVILNCIIFIFVYRRCKYCHRARPNVDNDISRSADLGVTTMNLLDQTDQMVAAHKQKVSNGHHKLEKSSNGSELQIVPNGHKKHTRVRHPAGDLKYGEQPHPPLHINTYIIHEDGCSGYSSEWEDTGFVNDCPGVEHHYIHINSSLLSQDPSGVFYAGSIDEDGVLHPPGDQCYSLYPVAPAPTMISSIHSQNHLSQLQEEDRRSRSSLHSRRSPFTCGRDSPSSGRGSPFRNRVNSSTIIQGGSLKYPGFVELEGQTLTYYGMIDGHGSNSDAPPYPGLSTNADNASNEEATLSVPPPSYEDAATGKYSPLFLKK